MHDTATLRVNEAAYLVSSSHMHKLLSTARLDHLLIGAHDPAIGLESQRRNVYGYCSVVIRGFPYKPWHISR